MREDPRKEGNATARQTGAEGERDTRKRVMERSQKNRCGKREGRRVTEEDRHARQCPQTAR